MTQAHGTSKAVLGIAVLGFCSAAGPLVNPAFDPSAFVQQQQNPYFPLVPGTIYFYEKVTEDGIETSQFEVTNQVKTILGVNVTVVHDQEFLNGELVEDTLDWFVPDEDGNVWYFGEDTAEIEDGEVVSTAGSWEAGQDGALPGVIMLANPHVGDRYREEDRPGVAEDMAKVLSLNKSVKTPQIWPFIWPLAYPTGRFENVLKTRNWNPLDPGTVEWKYYAPGVGPVLEVQRNEDGEFERKKLIAVIGP